MSEVRDVEYDSNDEESIENAIKKLISIAREAGKTNNLERSKITLRQVEYLQSQLQHLRETKMEEKRYNRDWWHNFWMIAATVAIAIATIANAIIAFYNLSCS